MLSMPCDHSTTFLLRLESPHGWNVDRLNALLQEQLQENFVVSLFHDATTSGLFIFVGLLVVWTVVLGLRLKISTEKKVFFLFHG
jgi:hypothetical protein